MSDDVDQPEERLSRKELAKFLRRKAYLQAKERRENDPRYQELKERARQHRRDAYQRQKEHRKQQKQKVEVVGEDPAPVEGKRFGHLVLVD